MLGNIMTGKELSIKNLRILTFGDIHGRSVWKDVIDREGIDNLDLIVFLGDYFTSREGIPVKDQEENFRRIVDFKNTYPDKVVLLRGNHDMEACKYYWAECHPSHRSKWVVENKEWFLENTQWVLQIDDVVFSHAGITKRWYEDMCNEYPEITCFEDINKIEPSEMFGFRPSKFSDYSGESETQPCTWIRPAFLCEYGFPEIRYVVGHSTVANIIECRKALLEQYADLADWAKCEIWVCDTLPREYLIIDHGEFIPTKISENTFEKQ